MSRSWLIASGLIATFGAVCVGLGEWFMLYGPDGGHGLAEGYKNFLHPTASQLQRGFYLGAFAAPLYILGYWHVVGMLRQTHASWRWWIMGLAVFGFMNGVVWLLTNAYLGFVVQAMVGTEAVTVTALQNLLAQIDRLSLPLLQIIRVTTLALSLVMMYLIWTKDTYYPRWMVLVMPFPLIVGVFVLFFAWPAVGHYVMPAALNVAHTIFFALSTFMAYRYAR